MLYLKEAALLGLCRCSSIHVVTQRRNSHVRPPLQLYIISFTETFFYPMIHGPISSTDKLPTVPSKPFEYYRSIIRRSGGHVSLSIAALLNNVDTHIS